MKVFVDTNVILDALVKREPFYLDAAKAWTLFADRLLEGCLSAISINNLYYIMKKLRDRATAESFVDQVLEDFTIVALTKEILKQARTIHKKDFEDLIQYFSAIHAGCDLLVTRNKKDFPTLGIRTISPTELLIKVRNGKII
jgi:predicted nucleic acid-binding protein